MHSHVTVTVTNHSIDTTHETTRPLDTTDTTLSSTSNTQTIQNTCVTPTHQTQSNIIPSATDTNQTSTNQCIDTIHKTTSCTATASNNTNNNNNNSCTSTIPKTHSTSTTTKHNTDTTITAIITADNKCAERRIIRHARSKHHSSDTFRSCPHQKRPVNYRDPACIASVIQPTTTVIPITITIANLFAITTLAVHAIHLATLVVVIGTTAANETITNTTKATVSSTTILSIETNSALPATT
jgi:hypothetical protein